MRTIIVRLTEKEATALIGAAMFRQAGDVSDLSQSEWRALCRGTEKLFQSRDRPAKALSARNA